MGSQFCRGGVPGSSIVLAGVWQGENMSFNKRFKAEVIKLQWDLGVEGHSLTGSISSEVK
jgi:hypothetical protein